MTRADLISISAVVALLSASMIMEPIQVHPVQLVEQYTQEEVRAINARVESWERMEDLMRDACADHWARSQLKRVARERNEEAC